MAQSKIGHNKAGAMLRDYQQAIPVPSRAAVTIRVKEECSVVKASGDLFRQRGALQ